MTDLELVNAQLESFSKPFNFDKHGELMKEVDAELASLKYRCAGLVQAHDYLTSIDEICWSFINRGRSQPSEILLRSFAETVAKLGDAAAKVVREASPLVSQGYRIEKLIQLRAIANDPGAGLHLMEVLKIVGEISLPEGAVKEVEFDDGVFEKLAEIRKAHPVTGED